jgi:hypothetical protein
VKARPWLTPFGAGGVPVGEADVDDFNPVVRVEVAIVVLCSVSDVLLVAVLAVEVDEPKPEPAEVEAEAEAGGEPPDAVSDDPPVLIVVVLNCPEPVVVGKELAGAPVVTAVDVDWFSLAVFEAGDRLLGWVVPRFGLDEAVLLPVSTPELTAGTELAPGLTDTDTSGEETDAQPDGET